VAAPALVSNNGVNGMLTIMRAHRSGHILVTSGIGGFTGFAGLGVYSAAKAAADVMNEALAQEVAQFGIKVTVLTLGIFRTHFASSSLKQTASVMTEYAETPAGRFRRFIGRLTGKQPNDPARGAQAILRAVAAENPPLHLALGRDALGVMRTKITSLQQDIATWEATSASVAFPQPGAQPPALSEGLHVALRTTATFHGVHIMTTPHRIGGPARAQRCCGSVSGSPHHPCACRLLPALRLASPSSRASSGPMPRIRPTFWRVSNTSISTQRCHRVPQLCQVSRLSPGAAASCSAATSPCVTVGTAAAFTEKLDAYDGLTSAEHSAIGHGNGSTLFPRFAG
jgi:short chain dehydrogenase